MARTSGNNPTTGSAHGTESDARDAVKAAAAAAAKAAQKLDAAIKTDLGKLASVSERLAVRFAELKESGGWRHLVGDDGKPFRSFSAYLKARSELLPPELPISVRNSLLVKLAEAGLSVRERATITGTSPATASQVVSGGGKNVTAGKRGDQALDPESPEARRKAAEKAFRGLEKALEAARDAIADMTDAELDALHSGGVEIANMARAQQKLNAKSQPKSAPAPKSQPASGSISDVDARKRDVERATA